VECIERSLDPLTTNLVVADKSRTDKTICLEVSPSLKAYGISGQTRLLEVVRRVTEGNKAPGRQLTGSSWHNPDVKARPELAPDYLDTHHCYDAGDYLGTYLIKDEIVDYLIENIRIVSALRKAKQRKCPCFSEGIYAVRMPEGQTGRIWFAWGRDCEAQSESTDFLCSPGSLHPTRLVGGGT